MNDAERALHTIFVCLCYTRNNARRSNGGALERERSSYIILCTRMMMYVHTYVHNKKYNIP